MLHTYFIPYEFRGTFGIGPNPAIVHDNVPQNVVSTYKDGRVGNFYVLSEKEWSKEELSGIAAKVVSDLPKGLSFPQFLEKVYKRLETKGLKRFEYRQHGSLDQKIIYDENYPEQTGIREPVLQH